MLRSFVNIGSDNGLVPLLDIDILYHTQFYIYIYIVKLYRDIGAIVTQSNITSLMARFLEPTWGPSGADRTQVGPMLASSTLLSRTILETAIQWTIKNIGQISHSQWTPHSLPGRASYCLFPVYLQLIDDLWYQVCCPHFENWPCYIGTELYDNILFWSQSIWVNTWMFDSIRQEMVNTLERPRQDGRHFGRWYFQMQFRQLKCFNFDKKFTELCFLGSHWQISHHWFR